MTTLRYLSEFNNYGVEKTEIEKLTQIGKIPQIGLSEEDYKILGGMEAPKAKIGFLLGSDTSSDGTEFYTVDIDYLTAMLRAGAEPVFLDYDNVITQLSQCDGLILPGGSFNSPQSFYIKAGSAEVSKRSQAYIFAAMSAEQAKKPILGICAGAQMIGGMHGRKMYASIQNEYKTFVKHKSRENNAHEVIVEKDSPLAQIMQTSGVVKVNSRHNEAMIEDMTQKSFSNTDLELYAVSKADGLPEAWGNQNKNILCIQWHPENLAKDNPSMQNIYTWLVDQAQEVKNLQQQEQIQAYYFLKK